MAEEEMPSAPSLAKSQKVHFNSKIYCDFIHQHYELVNFAECDEKTVSILQIL
jgi:hypothetical protein